MKKLKIWNGRPYGVLPKNQWDGNHIYVAAYSVEDIRRLCGELGLSIPSTSEIKTYWSAGCWGLLMENVTVERGIWVCSDFKDGTPKRLEPKNQGEESA